MKKILSIAIQKELTERQREMLTLYYLENKTMPEIAAEYNINKSTVSRTIKRAEEKLKRIKNYFIEVA